MNLKFLIVICSFYLVIVHLSAIFGYKVCRQVYKGINKECRNITCLRAKGCQYNSLFNEKEM